MKRVLILLLAAAALAGGCRKGLAAEPAVITVASLTQHQKLDRIDAKLNQVLELLRAKAPEPEKPTPPPVEPVKPAEPAGAECSEEKKRENLILWSYRCGTPAASTAPTNPQPPASPPTAAPKDCVPGGGVIPFGAANDKLEICSPAGLVTSVILPKIPASSGKNSGYINMLDSPGVHTPPSSVLEVSISRSPGVIDTNLANGCNRRFENVGYVSMYWLARTTSRFPSPEAINAARACYAPEAEGQWYLNARWTYAACAFGAATCGFKFYWALGSY